MKVSRCSPNTKLRNHNNWFSIINRFKIGSPVMPRLKFKQDSNGQTRVQNMAKNMKQLKSFR